ncbi:MAG: heparinase II/III family protein [Pseudomonadota bacterium]
MNAQSSSQPPTRERSADEDAALWARFRGAFGDPVKPAGKSWLKLVPSTPPQLDWALFSPIAEINEARAEAILDGIWRVGLERYDTAPEGRPWLIEAASQHFLDQVHRFDWLPDLMSRDDTGRALAGELVDAWTTTHGKFDGFSWRAGPCADRVWNWMRCGSALFEGQDGAIILDRQDCLFRQIDHLEGLADTTADGEARFRIQCCLVVAAALRGETESMRPAIEQLEAECLAQILPDGGHVSRSPFRLLQAAIDLLAVKDVLEARGHDVPKGVSKWIPRMGAMLTFFQADDGALFPFNGGEEASVRLVNAVIDTIDPAIRKFSFSPKSGYQKLQRGDLRLLLDVGAAPEGGFATGAHAGALGFELAHGRDRIVTSCGFTSRVNVDWQAAVRRTSAHSTLVLGGRDSAAFQKDDATRLLVAAGPEGVSAKRLEEGEEIWLDAQHSGYKDTLGLLHRRRLFMSGDGSRLTGEDSLVRPISAGEAEDNHPITFEIRFHLHPTTKAAIASDSIRVVSESGKYWRFKTSHEGARLERSIYLARGTVERTEQIVLAGRAQPNGDGTIPPNCVRWAFVKDGGP